MTDLPEPRLGVVFPVGYRVTDHLAISHVILPSTVVCSPDHVLSWAVEGRVTWLLVTSERTWRAVLPTVPSYPGMPVFVRRLFYADLHAFYAPTVDDLAMLPFCVGRRWWPEGCVECGGELDGYDEWCLPRCATHNPSAVTV